MKRTRTLKTATALAIAFALVACPGPEEGPDRMDDLPMEGVEGMEPMEGMPMEPGMMGRHADELDEATDRMRAHLAAMRQAGAGEWSDRMGEHVRETSGFLSLLRRQMREMDMGMDMDDDAMGEMMGMTGAEHRRMMEDIETLHSELETLQVAADAEVRQRMPAHLDRIERMVQMMEQSAAHMRGM